jgi:hypothetical protein
MSARFGCATPAALRFGVSVARCSVCARQVCECPEVERDSGAPHDLGRSEFVVLRMAIMDPTVRSIAEFADCAGLSIGDTVEAATRLSEVGLMDWRTDGEYTDLRPQWGHERWPLVAARVGAAPISWPKSPALPRYAQHDRREIDDFGNQWRRFRKRRPQRFSAELDDDECRAVSLLWLGISGFDESPSYTNHLVQAAYLLNPAAWWFAARCFPEGSLRQTIGFSLADSRTFPGFPPMLVVDRQRMSCSVCGQPAIASEGRHRTVLDSQLGEGLLTTSILIGKADLPFEPGCGVIWTHYTVRAWLAEVMDKIGPDGRMRGRMQPLAQLPDLVWLDP